MNREILFKGKRIDNREWVEGFYTQLPEPSLGATIIANEELCAEDVADYIITNIRKQHSNFSSGFPLEVVECEPYEVDPETVCQYTGMTDKNGRKIFEGDIIYFDYELGDWGRTATVLFEDGEYRYRAITSADNLYNCRICGENSRCKVIGNIFDNSELLGSD